MLLEHMWLVVQVIGVFVTALFVLSVLIKRNDIADIAWGTGIFIVALVSYLMTPEPSSLQQLLTFVAGLWGVRLTVRIFFRNIKKPEDFRYKKWRDEWGRWFYLRSYLQVYVLQGALMVVVGYSFIHASVYGDTAQLSAITVLGFLIWCVGYFFEVIGDWQLDSFIKSKPASGTILDTGLWRYTRHPNYFGEVTMWWGIWLMVAPLTLSVLTLISPLTITFLILKVSGIPMLEKKFTGNANFESYKARTNAFFPGRPKNPVS
jgi:steroid 5-alpha reductase family enzyme